MHKTAGHSQTSVHHNVNVTSALYCVVSSPGLFAPPFTIRYDRRVTWTQKLSVISLI